MSDESSIANADALLEASACPTAAAAMLLVSEAERMGQLLLAEELAAAAIARFGQDPGLLLAQVRLLARTQQYELASSLTMTAKKGAPAFLTSIIYEAQLAHELGLRDVALQNLRTAVKQCPDYPGLAGALASMLMPGIGYRDVLATLHDMVKPQAYLEIGVETGATLALARASRIVGIDPDLRPLRRERLAPQCELFEMTSAEFFTQHCKEEVLSSASLDLVFIDGLHRFEAAVFDFLQVERWANPNTVVVLHDALPIAGVYAKPSRTTRFWVGDVWKTVVFLQRCRPDLRLRIVPTAPSGLVVITMLKPNHDLCSVDYQSAIEELRGAELGAGDRPWPQAFPLVTNDKSGYREALGR